MNKRRLKKVAKAYLRGKCAVQVEESFFSNNCTVLDVTSVFYAGQWHSVDGTRLRRTIDGIVRRWGWDGCHWSSPTRLGSWRPDESEGSSSTDPWEWSKNNAWDVLPTIKTVGYTDVK